MIRTFVLVTAFVASLGACSKKSEQAAKLPALQPVKLEKLSLTIDVPGAATVTEENVGENPGVRVFGEDFGALFVVALPQAITVDEAKTAVAKEIGIGQGKPGPVAPTNPKSETLPDGFALTYQYTLYKAGGTEAVGENTGIAVYRTIGGKFVRCHGIPAYDSLQATFLNSCKSLR
jgi:hypothetical protein